MRPNHLSTRKPRHVQAPSGDGPPSRLPVALVRTARLCPTCPCGRSRLRERQHHVVRLSLQRGGPCPRRRRRALGAVRRRCADAADGLRLTDLSHAVRLQDDRWRVGWRMAAGHGVDPWCGLEHFQRRHGGAGLPGCRPPEHGRSHLDGGHQCPAGQCLEPGSGPVHAGCPYGACAGRHFRCPGATGPGGLGAAPRAGGPGCVVDGGGGLVERGPAGLPGRVL